MGMIDREKVIKGIRKCLSHKPCSENGCPYEDECAVEHLNDPLLRDALAMLKEQEAVEPRVSTAEQRCGYCNKVIEMDGWKTCPWCGKMIDWERWWNENGTHDNS